MFTGIIEAVGEIQRIEPIGGDMRLVIDASTLDMSDVDSGDSIAVNGICLTVIKHDATSFTADVSNETISLTTLKNLKPGSPANLEKALLPTTRLGGHLVSGHVDGLGKITGITNDARSIRYTVLVPADLKKYITAKGSICIDGTSLTVNAVSNEGFEVNIVPHTQDKTIFKTYQSGTEVNLEVDLIARYLESLLKGPTDNTDEKINLEMLAKSGFTEY